MTTLNIYYKYNDRPRRRVLSAIDPPAPLLSDIWKNVCLAQEGDDYAITFRSADAVADRIRYRYRAGGLEHVEENDLAFWTAPFKPGARVDQPVQASILLLLESPHFDEVSPCLEPYCPAAGETGKRIHSCTGQLGQLLQQVCGDHLVDGTPLILSNPVPHPASCRVSLGENGWPWWKELVFSNLLTRVPEIQEGFQSRLDQYQPKVIINACTKLAGTNPKTPNVHLEDSGTYKFQERSSKSRRRGAPTAPKTLVEGEFQRYLRRKGFTYKRSEFDETLSFVPEQNQEDSTDPDVYCLDLPHPSSWMAQ